MADALPHHARRPQRPQQDLADKLVALQRKAAGPPTRRSAAAATPAAALAQQHQLDPAQPQQSPALQSSSSSPLLPPPPPPPPASSSRQHQHRSRHRDVPDEFDRRLPVSQSDPTNMMLAASRPQHPRLFNPDTDPIPSRRLHHHRDVDVDSDASSGVGPSSRAATHRRRAPPPPLPHHHSSAAQQHQSPSSPPAVPPPPRQLFDPRHDDPIRFHVLTRGAPAKPPSGGYISASATSVSDAQSLGSSISLTSGTTSSSASNPYSPGNSRDLGGNRLWLEQMKRMYREITDLEAALLKESDVVEEDVDSRHSIRVKPSKATEERWPRLVREHKQLAELCHNFLSFALKPQVPASLQTLPAKYNIPARLWNHAFQRLLMALRRASSSSLVALEQLSSLIIYAYGFYTSLLEEENLVQFRILWLEALGDLSRYQMAVIAHVQEGTGAASASSALAASSPPASMMLALPRTQQMMSNSPGVSRMEESPLPSVGAHAAAELELEDDRELWRRNAREWYTKGIKDTPGQGRLHHHLGLVSADSEGEELRAVYHFAKSLISHHACDAARESILPLFSVAKQSARYSPSSPAPSIFLLLQGMLFTRIQLDDFHPTVARLKERIQLNPEEVTEAEWTMMAVLNIAAVMDFGRGEGVLRKVCGWMSSSAGIGISAGGLSAANGVVKPGSGRRPGSSRRVDSENNGAGDAMQVDSNTPVVVVVNEPEVQMTDAASSLQGPMEALSTSRPPVEELSYTSQLALQLMFEMLLHTMRHQYIRSKSPFRPDSVNPYLTTIFTFLATLFRNETALQIVEKYVPWDEFTPFFTQVYQKTSPGAASGRSVHLDEESSRGSAGKWFGSSPLPEDWCLRGSEWVRRVYERGFWRSSGKEAGGISSEMDVLIPPVCPTDDDLTDGAVEGENDAILNVNWTEVRMRRLRWSVEMIVKCVDGLSWLGDGKERCVGVVPPLMNKVEMWMEERKREEEVERLRLARMGRSSMGGDEMEVDEDEDEEDEDDPRDSEDVKALKARRRYLRSLQSSSAGAPRSRSGASRSSRRALPTRPPLQVAPGYTILVCDTNILLGSLPMVSDLVASQRWTVVVPLAVITELDGLVNQPTALGRAAAEALSYLIAAVQTQSTSLKVQTSKGNYLKSLSIRSEATTLGVGERNMDDLIVRSALWQLDHFVDRTGLLGVGAPAVKRTDKTAKVVMLTFDRNMRVKARSRQLDAADEKDMAAIINSAKY